VFSKIRDISMSSSVVSFRSTSTSKIKHHDETVVIKLPAAASNLYTKQKKESNMINSKSKIS